MQVAYYICTFGLGIVSPSSAVSQHEDDVFQTMFMCPELTN